jgi:hypothetical protein
LQLGKLYGQTDNRQAELTMYKPLLKEYTDHAEIRDRTAALGAQTDAKPAKTQQTRVPKSHRTTSTQLKPPHIITWSKLSNETRIAQISKQKPSITKYIAGYYYKSRG